MKQVLRGDALREAAKDPQSHGIGELTLPTGEMVRIVFFPEALAYYHAKRPLQATADKDNDQ